MRWWWWLFTAPHCCGNCRYWRPEEASDDAVQGTCRAELPRVLTFSAPPQVIPGGRSAANSPAAVNVQTYWPPVSEQEWCGRFRRRWSL